MESSQTRTQLRILQKKTIIGWHVTVVEFDLLLELNPIAYWLPKKGENLVTQG
jgi:hypothetical protein